MKVCASCGAKYDDNVTECSVCCDTQFITVCPKCSSPLDGESCPVCGYLTDSAAARIGSGNYPVMKPLEDTDRKHQEEDMALIYMFLGVLSCGVPLFTIPGVIYAIKALKSGSTSKKPFVAIVIFILSLIELAIAFEYYFKPIMFSS